MSLGGALQNEVLCQKFWVLIICQKFLNLIELQLSPEFARQLQEHLFQSWSGGKGVGNNQGQGLSCRAPDQAGPEEGDHQDLEVHQQGQAVAAQVDVLHPKAPEGCYC